MMWNVSGGPHMWAHRVGRLLPKPVWPAVIEWAAALAIIALAATLNFWNLSASGYGNLYYSAAVRSMAQSWHNFLFASYDPGGFVTVDKPPLGFWAQVVSVKLLGFSGFSLLLPEALAGVLSVAVLWRVVRRAFGPAAGVLAALALAISPINVVANRDNILEPLLTLTLLLAAWAVSIAAARGKLRWLLIGALLLGLGFNIKMLEAYLIVPALALVYLVGAPGEWRRRVRHLALAGAVMLALSFTWALAVDLTPAAQRPYIGSTTTNSALELALSYNGAGRLLGGLTVVFLRHAQVGAHSVVHTIAHSLPHGVTLGHQPAGAPWHAGASGYPHPAQSSHARAGHGAPPGRMNPAGAPGLLRLFQSALGSQVSWLAPLALMGLALLAPPVDSAAAERAGLTASLDSVRERWARWRREPRAQGLLLWGGWLLIAGGVFSLARSINAYYVAILAPAICALAGAGAVALWQAYRRAAQRDAGRWVDGWLGLLLPLTLLATAAQQAILLDAAPAWRPWLAPTLLVGALALALALGVLWLSPRLRRRMARWRAPQLQPQRASAFTAALAAVALAATIIAPSAWTLGSLTTGNAGGWPSAGPEYASAQPSGQRPMVDRAMMRYLLAHRGEDRFIVGALNSYITAPIIVATGQPVLDMGGFTGADPILTVHLLAQLVAQDQVHLFLLPSANVTSQQLATLFPQPTRSGAARLRVGLAVRPLVQRSGGATAYTNALTQWISMHCAPVPPIQWSSASAATHRLGAWELFACQS